MRCSSSAERRARLRDQRGDLRVRQFRQEVPIAGGGEYRQMANVLEQVAAEALRVVAVLVQRREVVQAGARIARDDRVGHRHDERPVGRAEDGTHRRRVGRTVHGGQHLLEQRLRVAQAALGLAGDQRDGLVGEGDLLACDGAAQLGDQGGEVDPAQVVALAARQHRGEDLVGIRGGEDELGVRRRLLQRLQQRIEGVRREHVDLVDDVDLEAALDRAMGDRLHQVAHLLDLRVRGTVDLEDVERDAVGDLLTGRAGVARLGRGAALAVERLGEDARGRGLAHATRPGEQEGVRDAAGGDRGLERARHVLLADHVCEALRPQPPREHLVGHRDGIGGRGIRR